ncbi:hypothetical protein HX109_11715 [Galbibacter sp. BG1]|uniref:hypothetical protein n=1 Tax=Galbibacter sp. BG1 TaxID=1170699 RepID=UPI0015BA7D42|nr:hypothetical protein [Galbibacter sp. BG1]QLE02189.1 hypothetical protein HX109_11715 [Galbibacter sp. BG1]
MKKLIYFFLCLYASALAAQEITSFKDGYQLKNDLIIFRATLNGSSIVKFKPFKASINPFDWCLGVEDQPGINKNGFDFEGHFLSLGTWGMPTDGEQRAGVKLYGDANQKKWVIDSVESQPTLKTMYTSFHSTIEKLDVSRAVSVPAKGGVIKITETVHNNLPIGRPYNILQHATFGGQFVDNSIIFSNAGEGFTQKGSFPRKDYNEVSKNAFIWPNGILGKDTLNLQTTGVVKRTFLTSHIVKDSIGWAVIYQPEQNLFVGYVWKTKEYPWVNFWQQYKKGKINGRAIEFATCGMGISFQEMMENDRKFYGRNSFDYIDAGENITRSYYAFTSLLNEKIVEVISVRLEKEAVILQLKNEHGAVIKKQFMISSFE